MARAGNGAAAIARSTAWRLAASSTAFVISSMSRGMPFRRVSL
jgi:hypothetical protein